MCTVTFIPSGNSIYLTSNRDEKTTRSKAFRPQVQHIQNGQQLLFPKDPDAGGSWIALKNSGDAAVLLNGAFIKHQSSSFYRRSRGLVLLEIIASPQPLGRFESMDLQDVEPFTVILFVKDRLYECRWNGTEKFILELNTAVSYIWSSATLFGKETQRKRKEWFHCFLLQNPMPSQEQILDFHHHGGIGNPAIDLRINKNGIVKTISISSLHLSPGEQSLRYIDLGNGTTVTTFLEPQKAAAKKEMKHAA